MWDSLLNKWGKMKVKSRKLKFIAIVISIIMLMCGCIEKESKIEPKTEIEKERITLTPGSYRSIDGKNNVIYYLNDDYIYEKLDVEELVIEYNSKSGNYIFIKDDDVFVNYLGKNIKIDDERVKSPKLSNDGNYLFYFHNSGILEPKVVDLKNETELTIDNATMISGQFIDWISDNKLIYYGIRIEDKKSGIFIYDLINKKEEVVYEINKGYISFLKAIEKEVVFIEENMENKKVLLSLENNNSFKEVTDKIIDIKDIIKIKEKVYILGKVKNDVYSIYEISNNNLHRVVYDFPIMINLEKGLSVSDKDELLFMGSNNDYNEQNIYSYSDGTVKLISQKEGNYDFINIK